MARLPLVSPLDRVIFLKAQPYLVDLPSSSLAAVAQYAEESFFRARQIVYERSAPDRIYFLASGGVRTQYDVGPPFDVYAPGGIGVVSLLAGPEHAQSAWALDDTLALSVDVGSFMQILEEDFLLYLTLAMQLARSLMQALFRCGPKRPPERGFAEERLSETYVTLDLVHRLARAREAPVFRGSNLAVLTELLRFQNPRALRPDELIFSEGEPIESMALVLDGTCTSSGGGGETLHPAGSMLGGWELLAHQPRVETYRAATAARIIEIGRAHFTDVLEDHFEFATDYLGKLCRRLVELRSFLAETRA